MQVAIREGASDDAADESSADGEDDAEVPRQGGGDLRATLRDGTPAVRDDESRPRVPDGSDRRVYRDGWELCCGPAGWE